MNNEIETRRPKAKFLDLDFTSPKAESDLAVVEDYARRFLADGHCHSTLEEYAEQASLDWKRPAMKLEVKRAVRRLEFKEKK